jgi:hypothetical protein
MKNLIDSNVQEVLFRQDYFSDCCDFCGFQVFDFLVFFKYEVCYFGTASQELQVLKNC